MRWNSMKTKIKYLLLLLLIALVFMTINYSYAKYSSHVDGDVGSNISYAKFVFEDQLSDTLNFDIKDFSPGSTKTINFSVTNVSPTDSTIKSDVSIRYIIHLKSYVLPLSYSLTVGTNPTNILTCNGQIDISCSTADLDLSYSNNNAVNYTLTVTFPEQNILSDIYNNDIDNIDLTIESYQKTL